MLYMAFPFASKVDGAFPGDLAKVPDAAGRRRLTDEVGVGVFAALALANGRFYYRRFKLRGRCMRLMESGDDL